MDAAKNTQRISLKFIGTPSGLLTLQAFLLDKEAVNLGPRFLEFHEQKLAPFLEFPASHGVLHVDGITLNDVSSRLNGWDL